MKRRWVLPALLTAVALLLPACGKAADSAPGDEFQVLAISPLSGALSAMGKLQVAGLEVAASVLNENGGVNGRQVKVTAIDNTGDAAKAVQALQTYLGSNEKPDLLMPGLTSQEIMAVLPLATQNEILTTHLGAAIDANDPVKFPLTFGASPTFEEVQRNAIDYLEGKGYKRIAFLGSDTASSRYQLESLREIAGPRGLAIESEIVAPDSADVTATLLKLKATNPDALFLASTGPVVGAFLSGMETAEWSTPVVGSTEICATDLGKLASPEMLANLTVNCFAFAVEGHPASQTEAFKNFSDRLTEYVDEPLTTSVMTPAFTYNELIIGAAAFEGAGNNDPKSAAQALLNNSTPPEVRSLFIGPTEWDFTADEHSISWGPDQLIFTPAGPMTDGMLVPAATS